MKSNLPFEKMFSLYELEFSVAIVVATAYLFVIDIFGHIYDSYFKIGLAIFMIIVIFTYHAFSTETEET